MKYIIENYDEVQDFFYALDECGKVWKLDLFTDASFPELTEKYGSIETKDEKIKLCESLIGKKLEIKETQPYIQCYFAINVKIIT